MVVSGSADSCLKNKLMCELLVMYSHVDHRESLFCDKLSSLRPEVILFVH